jgi:hypothetical protein
MNYVASQIIQREEARKPPDQRKWLSLMGNMHVNTQHATPGVADLLGVTSVYVLEPNANENKKSANVKYNADTHVGEYKISGDVVITIPLGTSSPRLESAPAPKKKTT